MQCTQINQLQTFANSDALSSSNFNCFSVISPLVPVLWARPTCLSSKGPKPHHLWCSLAKWECQQKLDMLTSKLISFAWSSLGTSLGAWNVSSYLLRPCLLSTLPLLTSGRPRAMLYELLSDSVPSDFDLASQNLFLVLEDCHESEAFFCAPVWEKFPETTMFPMVAGVPGPTLNLECGNRCCNDSKRQKIASPAFPDLKVKGMMEVSLTINQ